MSSIKFSPFGITQTFNYPSRYDGGASASQKQKSSSLASEINQNTFVNSLENHLNDVARGQGYLSSDVFFQVSEKYDALSQGLLRTDPKALANLNGLLTGLSYSQAARAVSSLEYDQRKLQSIPTKEEAQAFEQEILKIYGKKEQTDADSTSQTEDSATPAASPPRIQDLILAAGAQIQAGEKISKSVNDALGGYKFAESYVKDEEAPAPKTIVA